MRHNAGVVQGASSSGAGASRWATAAVAHVDGLSQGPPLDRSLRVTVNFHPDRVSRGLTVLEHLARDGVYRSQFETGTSNGGLTAHPGGNRWLWEQRIFGHAYDDAPPSERPKYGALDHRRRGLGGAPRFGSAHLRLREHLLDRATYCFPDSFFEPEHFGVERGELRYVGDLVAEPPAAGVLSRAMGSIVDAVERRGGDPHVLLDALEGELKTLTREERVPSLARSTSTTAHVQLRNARLRRRSCRRDGAGGALPSSSASSRWSRIASSALPMASSKVSPAEKQPGRSGTTTPKAWVSSPSSIAMG